MARISRRELILLLVGIDPGGGIGATELGGITRLQKYIFLLEKEGSLTLSDEGFDFVPYKKGPYSSQLYDDLEFLENLGLLESQITSVATDDEAEEMEALTFDFLMGDEGKAKASEEGLAATEDAYEERRFRLTKKGRERVERLLNDQAFSAVVDSVRRVKSRFVNHSLNDLLYYVYTHYPEMTTESDIRGKVLRRGGRG